MRISFLQTHNDISQFEKNYKKIVERVRSTHSIFKSPQLQDYPAGTPEEYSDGWTLYTSVQDLQDLGRNKTISQG